MDLAAAPLALSPQSFGGAIALLENEFRTRLVQHDVLRLGWIVRLSPADQLHSPICAALVDSLPSSMTRTDNGALRLLYAGSDLLFNFFTRSVFTDLPSFAHLTLTSLLLPLSFHPGT